MPSYAMIRTNFFVYLFALLKNHYTDNIGAKAIGLIAENIQVIKTEIHDLLNAYIEEYLKFISSFCFT